MTQVKKSYSFHGKEINQEKFDWLKKKGTALRDIKNEISQAVCEDFVKFSDMSKYDWNKHFKKEMTWGIECNSKDISCAIEDVYVAYENKISSFREKIKSKIQTGLKVTHYKKNTHQKKKGDVKTAEVKMGNNGSDFLKVMTYICKWHNPTFKKYLEDNYNNTEFEEGKLLLIRHALQTLNKFGDTRIEKLVKTKRDKILAKTIANPIKFKQLTFRGQNEIKQQLLVRNDNEQSVYNALIVLGGQKVYKGGLCLPVKFNEEYHGSIEEYHKKLSKNGVANVSYTLCFEKNRHIRVILTRDMEDVVVTGKTNYLGVDVNVKTNMFFTSDNQEIDYDRKMLGDYLDLHKKNEAKAAVKREHGLDTSTSNRDQKIRNKAKDRITHMYKGKCRELVDMAKRSGKDHIVLENLEQMAKGYTRSEEFHDIKYSSLTRLLHLADLKNIITSIANKNDIQVTMVQANYTSQTCGECGKISRDNRKTQEMFCCVDCGRTLNADLNAALNIEARMSNEELRKELLTEKSGSFTPKKLKTATIKSKIYGTTALQG